MSIAIYDRCSITSGRLRQRVQRGDIDPSFVISHRLPLAQAAQGYEIFNQKKDNCIKVVLKQ